VVNWVHLHLRGRKFEMRNYRNGVAALALALVLTTPAFAGIMYSEKTPPPPPPDASVTQSDPTGGIIYSEAVESAPVSTDTVTEVALSLLQNALTLL
jgi:hypothetical protein